MIARDKFGNLIYPLAFTKLKENGKVFSSNGYVESKSKTNLFYKKIPQGWFYADMRGTEEVPIWEDTSALFYWKFFEKVAHWKRRRLIKEELMDLYNHDCSYRLSHFATIDREEFNGTIVGISESEGWFVWDDGFCRFCGKDFQNGGTFCSKECEDWYEDKLKFPCPVCGGRMKREDGIKHHTSYFPEKIIIVHASCHNKIHKTMQFQHLKPIKDDVVKFYKN